MFWSQIVWFIVDITFGDTIISRNDVKKKRKERCKKKKIYIYIFFKCPLQHNASKNVLIIITIHAQVHTSPLFKVNKYL